MHEQQIQFDLLSGTDEAGLPSSQGVNGTLVKESGAEIPSHLRNPYDPNGREVSEAARDQGHGPYDPGGKPLNLNHTGMPAMTTENPKRFTPGEIVTALSAIASMRAILKNKR